MAADLRCKISADATGFYAAMRGIEGMTARVGASIRNKFLAAFSAGAIISLVRQTIEHVRQIDKVAAKYKLTAEQAQQLMEYSRQTREPLESIADSSEKLAKAWEAIKAGDVSNPFSNDQLDVVRNLDDATTRITNTLQGELVKGVDAATDAWTKYENVINAVWNMLHKIVRIKFDESKMPYPPNRNEPTKPGGFGRLIKSIAPVPSAWLGGQSGKPPFPRDYDPATFYPPEVLDLMYQLGNKEVEDSMSKSALKRSVLNFKPSTDTLASIGGFVGGGPDSTVSHLRAMNRHLAAIDRALNSKGIKIQEIP